MANPPLFHVFTLRARQGKGDALVTWWRETALDVFRSLPGIKSVRALQTQYLLGGEYDLEWWFELENWAGYDQVTQAFATNPQLGAALAEQDSLVEFGPSRVVAEWPDPRFPPQP